MTDRTSSAQGSPEQTQAPGVAEDSPGTAAFGVLDELRVRRLVVVDDQNQPRLVAEVSDGQAALRLMIPGTPPGHRTGVEFFARPPAEPGDEFGPGFGIQLWADGNLVAAFDCWEVQQQWTPALYVSNPEPVDSD